METTNFAALRRAIEICGSQRALARSLGISAVAVGQWLQGGSEAHARRVPPKQCVRIELLTGGAVSRKELRPDDWQDYWPDSTEFKPNPPQVQANPSMIAIKNVAQGVANV